MGREKLKTDCTFCGRRIECPTVKRSGVRLRLPKLPRVVVYPPWRNLGCLGLRFGKWYLDCYSRRAYGHWLPGLFVTDGATFRRWISPSGIRTERIR